MQKDWLGNSVSTSEAATIAGIDDFISGFLGYETKAANIVAAADNDPDCTLANAYAGILNLFLESNDAAAMALPYLERAEATAAKASRREQMTVAAVRAWADGDIGRILGIANEVADEFPHDLAMVKLAQYHHFNLGNCAGMLGIAQKVEEQNADLCYMHGLTAFGYEQCHLLEDAEKSARKAIELQRKEPWAQHALAHVLLTQGRIDEGTAFLEGISDTWVDLNSFMVTHNWWHLALKYISKGRYEDALALYDQHVWGAWKEYSQDQIGAVSLLLRLELVGVDVGDRWIDVANYLKARVDDFVQPFLTMQYIYGLARAGYPEAELMLQNLREFVKHAPELTRDSWQYVALPACEAMIDHAKGDYEGVVRKMGIAVPRLIEIGGSHAQRDLFDQILLDATIKTGRYQAAQQMLEMRRGYEPLSVPTNSALSNVYQMLGLEREAARALARVSAKVN